MSSRLATFLPTKAAETLRKHLRTCWDRDVDPVTLSLALKCSAGHVRFGTQLHALALVSGLDSFLVVSNSIMNMYCKSELFDDAFMVFEAVPYPDIVSWNTVLSGFNQSRAHAIGFTSRMHYSGVRFDPVTFTTALSFCSDEVELPFALQLHCLLMRLGFEQDTFVGNSLISMYTRCGWVAHAERVFGDMSSKDLISWNAMLSGYAQQGSCGLKAMGIFVEMMQKGMQLDHVSLASVISACNHEGSLQLGMLVHGLVIKTGCGIHLSVCNILMSMYSKCDLYDDAVLIFESMVERNVISWTTMISMSKSNAMSLFRRMLQEQVYPNEVTFVSLLHSISTDHHSLKEGLMVHGLCLKTGFSCKTIVANCLISMYSRFKSVEDSNKVFDGLSDREIVSWNALISGYAQNDLFREALEAFSMMILESCPNAFTLGSVLSVITSAESISLTYGQQCHCLIVKLGLVMDPTVSSALIDMYSKGGCIHQAQLAFDESPQRTQIGWTTIISAHSSHGNYEELMKLFYQMQEAGVVPDSITFLAILTACGRKGEVDRGRLVFKSMVEDYGIQPLQEHYACMVDMLGRAGRLSEAEEFVRKIPGGPGLSTLQSLLGSCRVHGNVELGQRICEALMTLEPMESGIYVLMSNMYAESGDWEKVSSLRKVMRDKGVRKEVGFSWVDANVVDGSMTMYKFSSNDNSHPNSIEICRMVEILGLEMKFLEKEIDMDYVFGY